jgi:hypothetical protein
MRTLTGFGIIVLATMWAATSAGAQEIEPGAWTGTLTPPGGADVAVTYEVGDANGALSIVMNNPQLGDIEFNDARLEGDQLTFWFAPGTRVECTLTRKEDRSFDGSCSDGRGADGQGALTMTPPSR